MMKNDVFFRFKLLLLLVITTLIAFACSENKKCSISPPEKVITLKIADSDSMYNVWTGRDRENSDMRYSYIAWSTNKSNNEMSQLLRFYEFNEYQHIDDDKVYTVVMFANINPDIAEKITIDKDHIQGFLIYVFDDKKEMCEMHTFIKTNDNQYREIKELQSTTNAATTNDFYSIACLFYNGNSHISSITLFQNPNISLKTDNKYKSNFKHHYNKYYKDHISASNHS